MYPRHGGGKTRLRHPPSPPQAKTWVNQLHCDIFPLTFFSMGRLNWLRGSNLRSMDGTCLELAGKVHSPSSPMSEVEEVTLIRRAQEGDRSAFDALVRLYDQNVLHL